MHRVLIITFVGFLGGFAACSQSTTPPQPAAANAPVAPSAAPSVSPSAMAVVPTLATPAPGSSVAPSLVPQAKDNGKQAKAEQKPLPPDLWQRMTRPLTLEEINKLPPETRDMILRAQGRLPASPAPAPKKK